VPEDTTTQPQERQPQPAQGQNMYRTLQEIDGRQHAIRAELSTIDALPEPTDDDVNWQGTLIQEYDALEERAGPLRRRMADIDRVMRARQDPANTEDGAPRTRQAPAQTTRSNRDPFEDMDRVRSRLVSSEELRSRAETVIETDAKRYELPQDFAETATRRAKTSQGIARHVLLTGSPEYREAFRAYLESPEDGEQRFRAMNLTAASGGYLLPYVLDPTIVLTNNASANPFRRISRGVTTTSNAWQGVNSAGVTAAWVAEGTGAADASPTLGQIQVTPVKGVAWVFGSYEALDDTDFGTQLPGLLADARDRLESGSFTTGSGTAVPLGIAAALGTGSRVAPSATGTAFNGTAAIPDVYNLQAALPPRFRNSANVGWIANIVAINKVRALDQYGGSAFWANFGSDTPEQLLGKGIYEASDMNATMTGASGATGTGSMTLLFGDWQQFIIADRVGVSMLYEPMVKGTAGSIPTGQAGWYMFWRTGTTISTTAAFRYLTIS
jgi:HK97 family phage major capsid protein